ncbi:MAG: M23 family metallopeptidase [Chloroflexi bacterium]|nr:M23 family metallopeptidase [Chloroflexota bacterium]
MDRRCCDQGKTRGEKLDDFSRAIKFEVSESETSNGGSIGNYLLIEHGDNTYAYYLHSPENGIDVEVADAVNQVDILVN